MDSLNNYGIYVHYDDLESLKGIAFKQDDCYIILINQNLSQSIQQETLVHELLHIGLGHLDEYIDFPNLWKEKEVNLNLERFKYAEE